MAKSAFATPLLPHQSLKGQNATLPFPHSSLLPSSPHLRHSVPLNSITPRGGFAHSLTQICPFN